MAKLKLDSNSEQNILNIAYALEEKINFKNRITDWWIK